MTMAANVHSVQTTSTLKELEREERLNKAREALKQPALQPAADTVEVQSPAGIKVASQAEVQDFQTPQKDSHDKLKEARSELIEALKEGGAEFSEADLEGTRLEELALKLLQGTNDESVRAKIEAALAVYQAARLEALGGAGLATQSVQAEETPEEKALRDQLVIQAEEKLGIKVTGENIEELHKAIFETYKAKSAALKGEAAALQKKVRELEMKLKAAENVEEKKQIEAELKAVQEKLNTVTQKIKALQQDFARLNALAEEALRRKVARELKVEDKLEVQSSKFQPEAEEQPGVSPEAKQPRAETAGGQAAASLQTASAGDAGDSYVGEASAASTGTVATLATDFTGTGLMLSQTGHNLRSEVKKNEQMIRKLLAMAMSGSWEAVKSALILLDKRASTTVIQLGAQTIKAMQSYEKQMAKLSQSLGKLNPKKGTYQSDLAKLNADMNLYSLNRQAIANFLRDTLTMREEIASITHSILERDSRIAAAVLR
jgi:hypothetical protein